jgi:hypothetical protein
MVGRVSQRESGVSDPFQVAYVGDECAVHRAARTNGVPVGDARPHGRSPVLDLDSPDSTVIAEQSQVGVCAAGLRNERLDNHLAEIVADAGASSRRWFLGLVGENGFDPLPKCRDGALRLRRTGWSSSAPPPSLAFGVSGVDRRKPKAAIQGCKY